MHFQQPALFSDPLFEPINAVYRADETDCVRALQRQADLDADTKELIADRARALVQAVRQAMRIMSRQ